MTTKMYLVLERTPLFFLDEEMQNLTDPVVEVSDDFFKSYSEIETQFRVLQEALFQMYLENELIKQKNPVVEDDDDDEEIFESVHDEPQRTLH